MKAVLIIVIAMAYSLSVHAQAVGSMSGRAVDSSGAAIPNANVTVKNTETGETRTTTSEDSGLYRVLSLPVGSYEIRAEKDGFKSEIRSGITLVVGQEAVINFTLEIGSISQEVTVSGEAPVVNTTTADISGLVAEQTVKELPLNGRNFANLIMLDAGTLDLTATKTAGQGTGLGTLFTVGGRRYDQNLFLLNGVEYGGNGNVNSTPGGVSGELLGIDAIREFNLQSTNYGAEFGKRAGGQIVVVTMSGSNQLHGTLFEFLRNSSMDARNFFDPLPSILGARIPHFERNNFGGSAGGPIKKDKSFIFGNYEGFRQLLGLSNVATVPDKNARNGFLPCATVAGTSIPCNTTTGLANVGVASGVAPYLALWPLPNAGEVSGTVAGSGGEAYYDNSPISTIREDFGTARFDQVFSSKDTLSAVYTIDDGISATPQVTNVWTYFLASRSQVGSISEVHVLSPNILNTFTVGASRSWFTNTSTSNINIPASLSLVQGQQLGALSLGLPVGGSGLGAISGVGAVNPQHDTRNLFTETDSMQISKGNHLISFGVWFEQVQDNSDYTAMAGPASFVDIVHLLQGSLQTSQLVPVSTPMTFTTFEGAWYVQDAYKITPRLTVTAGLRHEFTNGWSEKYGRMAVYSLGPSAGPNNVFGVITTTPAIRSNVFTTNNAKLLFEPRLGVAWDAFGTGKTVVHMGFGIYRNLLDNLAFQTSYDFPFNAHVVLKNIPFPFPQVTPAIVSTLTTAQLNGQVVNPEPAMNTPKVFSYNLKVEQSLGGSRVLSVAYNGSHSSNLLAQISRNTVPPIFCGEPTQLFQSLLPAGITGASCPASLPVGTQFYAYPGAANRNPNIGNFGEIESADIANYNALVVELTQRVGHGLMFKANYTYSSLLDDGSDSLTSLANTSSVPLNPTNLLQDYGKGALDVRHRVSVSASYDLPFGKGMAFGSNATGVVDKVIGGWHLNVIATAQSGLPFNGTLGFSQSADGDLSAPDRPSFAAGYNAQRSVDTGTLPTACGTYAAGTRVGTPTLWFNPCAFVLPVAGTYGNIPHDFFIGPGLQDLDLSVMKDIPVSEKLRAQFRFEGFNVLNIANFGIPNSTILGTNGAPRSTAGIITNTTTTARQMQIALKLIW